MDNKFISNLKNYNSYLKLKNDNENNNKNQVILFVLYQS